MPGLPMAVLMLVFLVALAGFVLRRDGGGL